MRLKNTVHELSAQPRIIPRTCFNAEGFLCSHSDEKIGPERRYPIGGGGWGGTIQLYN